MEQLQNQGWGIATGRRPDAQALITGSPGAPRARGVVRFYQTPQGVMVVTQLTGLPHGAGRCTGEMYGFHIHEGGSCTGNREDAFADAGGHFDPGHCHHPQHAGDLPPLLGNDGTVWSALLTNRFTVEEVAGRTVIVHRDPDDMTTQPSGHSGAKIACGVIRLTPRPRGRGGLAAGGRMT